MGFISCDLRFYKVSKRYVLILSVFTFTIFLVLINFILQAGVTLLLINLSNQTDFILTVRNPVTASVVENEVATSTHKESSFFDKLKKTFSWVGTKGSEVTFREEYHLTPKDGYLRSQTMVLNGIPLELTDEGDLPRLDPVRNNLRSPIYMTPLSIAFVVYPNFDAPACATHRKL